MANRTNEKPQLDQEHPTPWSRDLNPNRMAGQNIGRAEADERASRTAYDVKPIHRALSAFNDGELKEIPVLDAGTRLQQGATYWDLERGAEFTASGEMSAQPGQYLVAKDRVHYEIWNKLVGDEKP